MSDHDAVLERHNNFIAAFNEQDFHRMTDCITEDHAGMPPSRPTMRGREEAQQFWREGFALADSSFDTKIEQITLIDDIAIDHFEFTMVVRPKDGGQAVQDSGKCVWIWRRESDGAWRLSHAIWNSNLSEPALWSGG